MNTMVGRILSGVKNRVSNIRQQGVNVSAVKEMLPAEIVESLQLAHNASDVARKYNVKATFTESRSGNLYIIKPPPQKTKLIYTIEPTLVKSGQTYPELSTMDYLFAAQRRILAGILEGMEVVKVKPPEISKLPKSAERETTVNMVARKKLFGFLPISTGPKVHTSGLYKEYGIRYANNSFKINRVENNFIEMFNCPAPI